MQESDATHYRPKRNRSTSRAGVPASKAHLPGMHHSSPGARTAVATLSSFLRPASFRVRDFAVTVGLLTGIVFLGIPAAMAASQENNASAVSAAKKPHPPLFGKTCVN